MTEKIILNNGYAGILIRRSIRGGEPATGEKLETLFPAAVPPPEKGMPLMISSHGKTFRIGTAIEVKIIRSNTEFRQYLIAVSYRKIRPFRKTSPRGQEGKPE